MKLFTAFIIMGMLPAVLFAQDGVQHATGNNPAFSTKNEIISFPATVHDFGDMKQHARETYEFKFYNRGTDTLRLSKPHASCGCTAALLSSYDIAPGDSGLIAVTYTAVPGITGPIEKNVYVLDAQKQPQQLVTLTLKANIVGEIAINKRFIRYTSSIGDTEDVTIHVTSTVDHPLTLDNVSVALTEYADSTAGNEYHVENTRASPVTDFKMRILKKTLQPGESTDIILSIPSRHKGQINGSVRIALPKSIVTVGIGGVILRTKPRQANGG